MKIVKVPFSLGSLGKNKGCEKAPDKIVEKLKNFYVSENEKSLDFEVEDIKFNEDIDSFHLKLEDVEGDLFLGGDHSITYSLFKGLGGENKGLLIFDAHSDTEIGTNSVDHECFLRKLIEEDILKKENVIIVGIRQFNSVELKFLREHNIKYIPMKNIFEVGVGEICDIVMEFCNGFKDLYLSIDIDVVDPGHAPGTGYLEPGGLMSRELIYLVQRIKLLKNLKRVDIVEVNPDKDFNDTTSKLAAKIIVELS